MLFDVILDEFYLYLLQHFVITLYKNVITLYIHCPTACCDYFTYVKSHLDAATCEQVALVFVASLWVILTHVKILADAILCY
jgi:hypothetical protein